MNMTMVNISASGDKKAANETAAHKNYVCLKATGNGCAAWRRPRLGALPDHVEHIKSRPFYVS